jgi:predicted MFS family arabinose efflux permease
MSEFRELLIIFAVWTAGMFFAGSLFEVYFFNLGMSLPEIYLADAFWFISGLLILPLLKGFRTKQFLLAGIALALLSIVVLFAYPDPNAAYIYRLVLGMTHVFFWLPFNTVYYEFRKQNNASLSAVYYSVSPILALILPAVSGTIAGNFGYPELFIIAILTYVLSFILSMAWVKERVYNFDISSSLKAISGLRTIMFLEGFSVMVITSLTLPIMILYFLEKPEEVGWFLSLATIFSIVASFLVSEVSDRMHNRRIFLISSAFGFGISVAAAAFSQDIMMFFIAFGMINFFARIFSPISLALAVDNSKNLADTMAGREYMLNMGRLAGAIIGYMLFVEYGIETALLFQGLAFLLYLPIFELKRKKLKN